MIDTSAQRRQIRRNLILFYGLATAIAWAGWIPYAAQQVWNLPWHMPLEIAILAQYSPTIAAVLIISAEGGSAAVVKFLRTSLNGRVGLRWYAVALLTAPAMGGGLIALHALHDVPLPALEDLRYWPLHVAGSVLTEPHAVGGVMVHLKRWASSGALQATLVYVGLSIANGGVSEEAGWRGYAFPRLLQGRTAIVAACWLGLVWGVWHTGPNFWAGIFKGDLSVFRIPVEYTLGTIPLTVMICWVFLNAKRSLLPGILFHATYNATFFILTSLWNPEKPVVTIPEWLAATYVAALIVLVIGRKTLFAREVRGDDTQLPLSLRVASA